MTPEELPDEEEYPDKGDDAPDEDENYATDEPAVLVAVSCYLVRIEHVDTSDDDSTESARADSRRNNGKIYRPCLRQETITLSINLAEPARTAAEHAVTSNERYKEIKEAAADYAGNRVVNAIWSADQWRPEDGIRHLNNAAEALDTAADWLHNLVEQPIDSLSTSAGVPDPLAAVGAGVIATYVLEPITGKMEEAAKIFEVVGIAIGLATGLHPLVLACAKPLAHSEIAQLVADGLNEAMSPTEAHSGTSLSEATHSQEGPSDRQRKYPSPGEALAAEVAQAQERRTRKSDARDHLQAINGPYAT